MIYNIVKHRRGTLADWEKYDLVPEDGELIIVVDNIGRRLCKIGNGITKFSSLPYVTDFVAEEFDTKLNSLQTQVTNDLTTLTKTLRNNLTSVEARLSTTISNLETTTNEELEALNASISTLMADLNALENSVISLVQP